ncbi:MAG: sensor histidine kinase [Gammaproteobacteria bacterium]|nr:MAG: sensor histidine kinase [Gammaproteobacteria bacterium]
MQITHDNRFTVRLMNFGGLLIWIAVGIGLWGTVSIWGKVGYASNDYYSLPVRASILGFHLLFGVSYLFGCFINSQRFYSRIVLSIIQLFSAFAITSLLNTNVAMALFVQFISQVVFYIRFKWCMLIILILTIALYLLLEFYWGRGQALSTAGLIAVFMFFITVSNYYAVEESSAKELLEISNRELLATQILLTETTRQSERIRIARNIHDLVGHHLTALSINLEIASHLTEGKAKEQIDQAHSISTLLLSDVRQAVSEIRDNEKINLADSLYSLVNKLPKLNVEMRIDEDLAVRDAKIADVILRCVQESLTNALKHANASEIKMDIKMNESDIMVLIKDNGIGVTDSLKIGNGLTGMRERVESVGGAISFDGCKQQGFAIDISLPISG